MWIQLVVLAIAFIVSLGLTGLVRHYALTHRVVDRPTERSSHSVDTPTGGGLGFALTFMGCLMLLWLLDTVQDEIVLVLIPAGGLLALIGAWDDHSPLPPILRLIIQVVCCGWAVYWFGAHQIFNSVLLQAIVFVIATFALVWLVNLYNFMDGIDGIAAIEAVTVAIGWCVVAYFADVNTMLLPSLLACSVLGFLYWNFPPARIFMGDSGSVFIGFVFGCFLICDAISNPDFLFVWLILLGVFVVDASLTLARRLIRGENPLSAHRTHAYQLMALALKSHKKVTLRVAIINLCWLLPIALSVGVQAIPPWSGLFMAYAPLILLVLLVGGGGRRLRLR